MKNNINFKKSSTEAQVFQLEDSNSTAVKIDIRFKRYINTALIIGPMTMIMALVGIMRNYGLHEGWFVRSILTWLTMFPIAYACAFFVIPMGNRLTNKIKFSDIAEKNK